MKFDECLHHSAPVERSRHRRDAARAAYECRRGNGWAIELLATSSMSLSELQQELDAANNRMYAAMGISWELLA